MDPLKLKLGENGEILNTETGEPFQAEDGRPVQIEGVKTQEDVDKAVGEKVAKVNTLREALKNAQSDANSSKEQIENLQKMLDDARKSVDEAKQEAQQQSALKIKELAKERDTFKTQAEQAARDLQQERITNAIMAQASAEGREFIKPHDLLNGLMPHAKFVERIDEKNGAVIKGKDGKPIVDLLFDLEVDEADSDGKKTGKRTSVSVPVDKAAELYAEENPHYIRGRNKSGLSGGMYGGQEHDDDSPDLNYDSM